MKISKNSFKVLLPFYLFFTILGVINLFMNVDILLLALFFFFLIRICLKSKTYIMKYMFMVVMFSYHVLSVFISDNLNIYFYNLMKSSYHSGALFPLLIYYILFFSVIYLLEMRNKNELDIENQKTPLQFKISGMSITPKMKVRYMSLILIGIMIYMVLRMKSIGFYSLGGIDRFQFRATYFNEVDEKFYTYISWLLPIPLLGNNLQMKKQAIFFLILFFAYMIFVGDKFGSFFIAIYFYFLVTWATRNIDKKMIKKFFAIVVVLMAILLSFVVFQVMYERGSWEEVIIYFNNRLSGGQSDLWWGVFSTEKDSTWHLKEFFLNEVSAIFSKPNNIMEYNFGIYKMMRVTAPASVVSTYLSNGSRFAASTQASLFYYFKYTGLIIGAICLGMATYYLVTKVVRAYQNNDIIKTVLYTMFVSKLIQIMMMSDITMISNVTTIVGFIALLIVSSLEKRKVL